MWIDKRVLRRRHGAPAGAVDRPAAARGRCLRPLPHRRSAAHVHRARAREDRVSEALRPILGSELRNELGKRPFASLLSPEREGVMENVRSGLDRVARQYGAEIIDVRIKKADLPDGTPLQSAYDRMRTARSRKRARSAPKAPSARRSSAPKPTPRRRGPMPRASARTPNSTNSTVRCSPTRRPSSATATTSPRRRRSSCRRRTTI